MVRDHDVHAERAAERHLLNGRYPAVDRDDQRGAPLGQALNVGGRHAVAVDDPIRNQPVAVRPQLAQGADQDRRRADAVDVEIAVDGDPPAGLDRREHPLDHVRHRPEGARRVDLIGGEEGARRLGRSVAAAHEGDGDRLTQAQLAGKRACLAVRVRICPVGVGALFHVLRLRTTWDGFRARCLPLPRRSKLRTDLDLGQPT